MKLPIQARSVPGDEVKQSKWYGRLPQDGKDAFGALQRRIRELEADMIAYRNLERLSFSRVMITKNGLRDSPFPVDGVPIPMDAGFVPDQSVIYIYPHAGQERTDYIEVRVDNSYSDKCAIHVAVRGDTHISVRGDRALAVRPESGNALRIHGVPWG